MVSAIVGTSKCFRKPVMRFRSAWVYYVITWLSKCKSNLSPLSRPTGNQWQWKTKKIIENEYTKNNGFEVIYFSFISSNERGENGKKIWVPVRHPIPIAALLMFQISLVESSTRVSRQWTNANDSCVMSVMWHGYQYTFICLSGFI